MTPVLPHLCCKNRLSPVTNRILFFISTVLVPITIRPHGSSLSRIATHSARGVLLDQMTKHDSFRYLSYSSCSVLLLPRTSLTGATLAGRPPWQAQSRKYKLLRLLHVSCQAINAFKVNPRPIDSATDPTAVKLQALFFLTIPP